MDPGQLFQGVVTIFGEGVDVGRLEEVDIIIMMQGLYRYLGQLGKFAYFEHEHDCNPSWLIQSCV